MMDSQNLSKISRFASPTDQPRRRLPAWLAPAGLLAGFLAIALLILGDRIIPARTVRADRVLAIPASTQSRPANAAQANSTGDAPAAPPAIDFEAPTLFQATGWTEADTLPVKVPALIDGVVASVHVLDGDRVEAGTLLATLVDDDARLARDSARQELEMARAETEATKAEVSLARSQADAERARRDTAKVALDEAESRQERYSRLPAEAMSSDLRESTRYARDAARARFNEANALVRQADNEIVRRERMLALAEARLKRAVVILEQAELTFSRTRITAPKSGRIQKLHVTPGQKRMRASEDMDSATIVTLFDPSRLQVRIDVPLADAARLHIGQAVRMRSNLLPDRVLRGRVARINGEADLQRNTLQCKVTLEETPAQLTPEMLCRAEFLVDATAKDATTAARSDSGDLRILVPESALFAVDGDRAATWTIDPATSRVTKAPVTLSGAARDAYRTVAEGLLPGQWIVLSPAADLSEGDRVDPRFDDRK